MLFFQKKPELAVDVLFLERLKKLEAKVNMLENDILNHETSISSLREKILIKLRLKSKEETEESKDLYNNMFPRE